MSHSSKRLRELQHIAVGHAENALMDYDYFSVVEDERLLNDHERETVHRMIVYASPSLTINIYTAGETDDDE